MNTPRKPLKERQAIIDKIKQTQPKDFLKAVIKAGLNPTVDFAFADLSNVDLTNADLREANLEGVNFRNVNFGDYEMATLANLSRACLRGAFFGNTNLAHVNLIETNLSSAFLGNAYLLFTKLNNANLEGASLLYAIIPGACLDNASLKNANLSGINLSIDDEIIEFVSMKNADLSGANLNSAYLIGINMQNACLVNADMENAILDYAELEGADLSNINLKNASLSKTKLCDCNLNKTCLTNAYLKDVNLSNANFNHANLLNTNLQNANLINANFDGANLSYSNLYNANLKTATFKNANLSHANLMSSQLEKTDLSNTNFTGAFLEYLQLNSAILNGAYCESNKQEVGEFIFPSLSDIDTIKHQLKTKASRFNHKWIALARKTATIDITNGSDCINTIYKKFDKAKPEIIFCNSPLEALKFFLERLKYNLRKKVQTSQIAVAKEFGKPLAQLIQKQAKLINESALHSEIIFSVNNSLFNLLGMQIHEQVTHKLRSQIGLYLYEAIVNRLDDEEWLILREYVWQQVGIFLENCICPELWASKGSLFDFKIEVLGLEYNAEAWELFQTIVNNFGWIYPFENICIVCHPPIKIRLDAEQKLHAEGKAAIQFSDNASIYSYHGITLPEKYGKELLQNWQPHWYLEEPDIRIRQLFLEVIPSHKWQAQWLLSESNSELRREIILGIGYNRIAEELQAIELDSWQEYTLIKIDAKADVEPIYLLKMICPSTGNIHVLRVPPDMQTAREAIKWVNWGTDADEFSVQT